MHVTYAITKENNKNNKKQLGRLESVKERRKIWVLKEYSGAWKQTFYLPRLRVPHNCQCEVAAHFIDH